MARKAYGLHATQVNTSTYPDDGTSPVGSNEWNEALDNEGMLGFTKQNATTTISSGALLITDSVCVVAAESSTSDDLDSITLTNTSEYDLVYLFADTGDTITLKHGGQNGALNVNGEVSTVSGADETLSTTKPTILIRVGNYWYGYGGGTVSDGSISTVKLAADAVTGAKLADNAVDSEHYTDGSIDLVHLSANSVDSDQYVDGSIDNAHLADDAVGADELAANAVVNASVASGAAIATSKLSGALTSVASHGLATSATTDTTSASNVTSGTLPNAQLPDIVVADLAAAAVTLESEGVASNDNDTSFPTSAAVKDYVDTTVASDITLKGNYDASADSPSLDDGSPISGILKGDHYVVSAAGDFFTETMAVGDSVIAKQDSPTTLSHWITVNNNMVTPIVTGNIAADAITGAKIADDAIDSEHYTDGSIDTAHIADNQITLAKLAGGTDGNLISYDTNGDPAAVATGTATHVLTSNGAGAAPTFQAPAGGSISGDQDYSGLHDIFDLQRLSLENQSSSFDTDGTNNPAISNETTLYARAIDSNNDGIFCRVKKNGANVYLQIA